MLQSKRREAPWGTGDLSRRRGALQGMDDLPGGTKAIRAEDGPGLIPADAVTTSGSGLDPDVSPAYARLQAARIARARGVPVQQVQSIIDERTEGAFLGFIGQPHVNVLMTNRALDARFGAEG